MKPVLVENNLITGQKKVRYIEYKIHLNIQLKTQNIHLKNDYKYKKIIPSEISNSLIGFKINVMVW